MFKVKKYFHKFLLIFLLIIPFMLVLSPDFAYGEKTDKSAQGSIIGNVDKSYKTDMIEDVEFDLQKRISAFKSQSYILPGLPEPVKCDYFLKNGLIVDGSGGKPYPGNVAIKGDTIVDIGFCLPQEGAVVIDMGGRTICPGFIDIHTHTEDYWLAGNDGEIVLRQGVTTQINGNCGTSTSNISRFLRDVDGSAINVGTFMGYKALRRLFILDSANVTPEITAKMAEQLKTSIANGAFGFSLGLSYYPQNKATYSELLTLAKATKEAGGLLSMHIRDEYDDVIPSLAEAISLAKESGAALEYSHIKVGNKKNWDKQDTILQMMEAARANGVDILGDVYAYDYSSWDVSGITSSLSEDNVRKVMQHELVMIGSDSGLYAKGIASHPRAYANPIRVLAHYVRDEGLLTLEEAVMKMTGMPAGRLALSDRGLLKKGMKADIAVFYLENLKENAIRTNPNLLSDGISYLFVNGQPAISEGQVTGIKAGEALKRVNRIGDD